MPKIELKNGKYVDDQMADGVPKGGTSGQVLKKNSNNDYDLVWDTGGSSTIPTLQDVTTAGNVTEDNIRVKDSAFPTDYVEITSNSVNFNSSLGSTSLSCYPVGTGNVVLLPIQSGTTALTVNGVSADSNGDVVIPVGTGTVTSITVSSPLTGGTITTTGTIGIPKATGSADGYLSSIDWSTFNGKQNALSGSGIVKSTAGVISYLTDNTSNWDSAYSNRISSLTTTGSSGSATLVSNTLNIPTYTLSGLGGQAELNGTGFVKASGTTISYDNSTYITSVGTGVTNELTYWSGTNTIGSLSTSTYPSLTELSYLKGVTSALQTQLAAKQDLSLSAYSFMANNTASTANATAFTFKEVASQTLSSGITWNGTPPSGTQTHQYRWCQIGNLVTFYATLLYTTAGTSNSQLILVLPADCPTPYRPSSLQNANDMLYYGAANMSISRNTVITATRPCMLRRNTANTGFEIIVTAAASSMVYVSITIQYFTN